MSFIRQTLFRQVRTFSSTPVAYKTLTESVKDTAAAINQKVGQAAASGIQAARTSSIFPIPPHPSYIQLEESI